MGKVVRKFLLDDAWSIGKNESWFSDMASKGLHLKSIGRVFAKFEKGEPRKTKYRIDVLYKKPSQEQLDIYKDYGWDFVAASGNFYIFSSPESSNFPELHTDPEEQGYTLLDLDRRLRNNLIIISAAMLLFFGMMFSVFFLDSRPYLSMVEGPLLQQILLVVVEAHVLFTVIRNFAAVRKLRKSLLEGNPVNHKESWQKSRFINGTIGIFFITIALFSAFIPWIGIIKSEDYTLPETGDELPVIRLAEIEQNPALLRKVIYNSKGVDWGNRVSYDWSLLAPAQYEMNEHGIVNSEMWDDKSGEYSPSINTQFYRLTFPQMAPGLIQDLIKRYVYEPDVKLRQIENTPFDLMYVTEDETKKQIFASFENKVIYIRYFGKRDIEHIVSIVSERQIR